MKNPQLMGKSTEHALFTNRKTRNPDCQSNESRRMANKELANFPVNVGKPNEKQSHN